MKTAALIVVIAFGLIISVALWFRDKGAVVTSASRPWPGGIGPLDAARDNWPPMKANAASARLTDLAAKFPANPGVDDFVEREMTRGELAIGDPPKIPDVSAIRDLLLREQVVWERYDEIGDGNAISARAMQMAMARQLVASALSKARANDPAAWDDLRAVWKLARSLDGHPQMMTQTAALSMVRMVNAVAWKMPLPAPAWFPELQERDNVRPLLEAFHFMAAWYWEDGSEVYPTKWLANSIDHDRRIVEGLYNQTRCDVSVEMNDLGTDLTSVWRRAFRYRAEREATANALRIREGKPIEARSRCSDGAWEFDGMTLRFTREISTPAPDSPMPLVLRVANKF
ncbi:MAG: hypothetical protein AB7H86_05755 [Blastocatellales bacterium]